MEIRTGSSDSNSSRHESSSFESVQRRSNVSQYGRKKRSVPSSWTTTINITKRERKETLAYKRSLNSGSGGPERKQRKGQKHHGEKGQLTLSSNNELQYSRKRR
ncbi:uncharacterized protein TNCV_2272811 [Trichonephila clavipes]|nr:uncharacterized protein TNCV_2272811 [Trichonephila clavipes]